MLRLSRVTQRFGARTVLNEISLEVGAGEYVAIVGESTAHPAVLEAAVVAEADDKGATIAAVYVALRPGHAAGDTLSKEIMEEAAKKLPRFKRPQRVHFMEALPRTATGKVQRFKLRQLSAR